MAEIDNFSEINDNFDTIKTLLNSIRAQGILNTSDVDKLLSGINSKLEKINTEEDIDLIKAFLSELKQNLDERHSVLISKFGAIESLFSNLLKNSADALKSGEVKELFDIVATNLSVFSREVVSQKETLNDITLRLDAMRSDDSQKKDIIKNISVLKTDIEHLSNGFDSIVLSLNENFKTVVKTISGIDQSEAISKFGSQIEDILNSSNTVLSALQLLDKKNTQIEDLIGGLATKDDISSTKKNIAELVAQNKVLTDSIDTVAEKSYKIDSLAEKIDASVNIIAGLKSIINESDEHTAISIKERLDQLEKVLREVTSDKDFETFKMTLEALLRKLSDGSDKLQNNIMASSDEIKRISADIKALDINSGFKAIASDVEKHSEEVKTQVVDEASKISQLMDANVTRTLNDISSSAANLNSHIKETQTAISDLCEKSFVDVMESITGLKSVVAQIDENSVSANNAIFSNISDRLAIFENSLKNSLDKQEEFVLNSSSKVVDQVAGISQIAGTIDYKLDSSIIEINNSKSQFEELKNSIDGVLALDFVNVVKDLKVDLYAVKQDLTNAVDNSSGDLSEKFSNDLLGKYELLISRLDNAEDEIKNVQKQSLDDLKDILEKISSSIVDVISYVSTDGGTNTELIDSKLNEIAGVVKDSNLNYIENVRDIVEVIRTQVEINLKQISEGIEQKVNTIENVVNKSAEEIKQDVKNSYDKLVEVQGNFDEIKESLNLNKITLENNLSDVLNSAESVKGDFEAKMTALRNALLDKISEYKQEFTCENADKISEIKFNSENLHSKSVQTAYDLKNELKNEISEIIDTLRNNINELSEQTAGSALKTEGANKEIIDYIKNDFCLQVNSSVDTLKNEVTDSVAAVNDNVSDVLKGFTQLETSVGNLASETTTSLSSTLAKILENFVALKSVVNSAEELQQGNIKKGVEEIREDFAVLRHKFETADNQIDEDLAKQISIIESNFDALNTLVSELIRENEKNLEEKMDTGLAEISDKIGLTISSQLEQYKSRIEEVFDKIKEQGETQSGFLKERVLELNSVLQATLDLQHNRAEEGLIEISNTLKTVLEEKMALTAQDYTFLRDRLSEFADELSGNNNALVDNIKEQIDEITKFVNSSMEIESQELNSSLEEISASIQKMTSTVRIANEELDNKVISLKTDMDGFREFTSQTLESNSEMIATRFDDIQKSLESELSSDIQNLHDKINALFEENSINTVTRIENSGTKIIEEIKANSLDLKTEFDALNSRLDKDELSQMNVYQAQFNELSKNFNDFIEEKVSSKLDNMMKVSVDLSDNELNSLENYAEQILNQAEIIKSNITNAQNIIDALVKDEFKHISEEIEKETDVIVGDVIEQFSILREEQKDNLTSMVSQVEGSVAGYVLDSVNDIKAYLDVKTDSTVMNSKIDSLRNELENTASDLMENIGRLLEVSVFAGSISDIKATNEVLVTSMADKLNSQITDFVKTNVANKLEDKLNLFDKKFIDTIVDKFEEVKLLSTEYNNSFERISASVQELISKFVDSKDETIKSLKTMINDVHGSINDLHRSFADLKAQILNKSFDEAFQASINKQVEGIQNLVREQMGYIEDISDLCANNLPELTEMNALVKYGIKQAITDLTNKVDSNDFNMEQGFAKLKSDIITQFLNIFNQISFIAEQEEILDFIQEKHSELITILSHIVTTTGGIENVKDNLAVVDNKMDSLKENIDVINKKISSIMSSDGDSDYIYSLQDLESDIANLRIVLNEMKDKVSTFEAEELKQSFDNIAEDIVSISTRTNKLLLASDESYKTLQDNLQDFKLVINDLDERTKNFAHESGMDIIDRKLGTINTMMKQGAQTNQVFNQVFEYLAEWVDKAGSQISAISERVETLNDIGQIRVMLEDLRAQNADNSESEELIGALGNIFEKQAKRISSLEAKLDRVIVENNINSKNNKLDITPMEDTLNKFLAAMDGKLISQQEKINSLESKLEEVVTLVDNKDTAQLTKKVGGMDKQIAKLNKSIEKIASHVVEK